MGINIVAIGNGNVKMAQVFQKDFSIPFPLYTDPSKESYKILSLKRSFGFGVSSWRHIKRVIGTKHRQGMVQGDPWQQGGEGLFRKDGSIFWMQKSDLAGGHCSVEELDKQLSLFGSERV